jgi:hypothetical protein
MACPPFSCRTLAPWDEVKWGFATAVGLRAWLRDITGDEVSYSELKDVRAWLQGANEGDVVYMNSDWRLVERDMGDIEIRCNRSCVV